MEEFVGFFSFGADLTIDFPKGRVGKISAVFFAFIVLKEVISEIEEILVLFSFEEKGCLFGKKVSDRKIGVLKIDVTLLFLFDDLLIKGRIFFRVSAFSPVFADAGMVDKLC